MMIQGLVQNHYLFLVCMEPQMTTYEIFHMRSSKVFMLLYLLLLSRTETDFSSHGHNELASECLWNSLETLSLFPVFHQAIYKQPFYR